MAVGRKESNSLVKKAGKTFTDLVLNLTSNKPIANSAASRALALRNVCLYEGKLYQINLDGTRGDEIVLGKTLIDLITHRNQDMVFQSYGSQSIKGYYRFPDFTIISSSERVYGESSIRAFGRLAISYHNNGDATLVPLTTEGLQYNGADVYGWHSKPFVPNSDDSEWLQFAFNKAVQMKYITFTVPVIQFVANTNWKGIIEYSDNGNTWYEAADEQTISQKTAPVRNDNPDESLYVFDIDESVATQYHRYWRLRFYGYTGFRTDIPATVCQLRMYGYRD